MPSPHTPPSQFSWGLFLIHLFFSVRSPLRMLLFETFLDDPDLPSVILAILLKLFVLLSQPFSALLRTLGKGLVCSSEACLRLGYSSECMLSIHESLGSIPSTSHTSCLFDEGSCFCVLIQVLLLAGTVFVRHVIV